MKSTTNILLEGLPGVGKTTLIKRIVDGLEQVQLGGFYTEEIREQERRVGFRISTFDGAEGLLAHVKFQHGPRVGRYTVDVPGFEEIALPCLKSAVDTADVILIDEIGKMELFSERFRGAITACLYADQPVIATIMHHSHSFSDRIKQREDVRRVIVDQKNRNLLVQELVQEIS